MADVFISYKSERRRAAEHLKRIIEAHGFSVWYDYHGLKTGPDFGHQIEEELRAAKVALVLWCDRAIGSQWVREEADLAKALGIYVPLKIASGIEPPLGFRLNQHIDLSSWDGSPRSGVLDAVFDDVERLTSRECAVSRAALRKIEDDWRIYGALPILNLSLETPQEERVGVRSWRDARAFTPDVESPAARVFARIRDTNEVEDLKHFIETFPATEEAFEARRILGRLLKQQTIATHQSPEELIREARSLYRRGDAFNYGVHGEEPDKRRADTIYKEALEKVQQAVRLGSIDAMDTLSDFYWYGDGVERDQLKAMELCHEAATAGARIAYYSLGTRYRSGGSQLAANPTAARKWLRKFDDASTDLLLAEMHLRGEGGPIDKARAAKLLQKVTSTGSPSEVKRAEKMIAELNSG